MKFSVNINRKALLLVVVIVMVANAAYFYHRDSTTYKIKCESFVSHQAKQADFGYDVVITMDLKNNGKGTFGLEGTMRKGNDTWSLNRDVFFTYTRLPTKDFKMENVKIVKYGRDNSPEDVFNSHFFDLKSEDSRTVSLAKVQNGYLVGTLRAPVFICL
ncbi:hypothetical protein ACLBW2_06845 [Enterobacteriaceae bacterium C23F]